jgi:hypothetical protein
MRRETASSAAPPWFQKIGRPVRASTSWEVSRKAVEAEVDAHAGRMARTATTNRALRITATHPNSTERALNDGRDHARTDGARHRRRARLPARRPHPEQVEPQTRLGWTGRARFAAGGCRLRTRSQMRRRGPGGWGCSWVSVGAPLPTRPDGMHVPCANTVAFPAAFISSSDARDAQARICCASEAVTSSSGRFETQIQPRRKSNIFAPCVRST